MCSSNAKGLILFNMEFSLATPFWHQTLNHWRKIPNKWACHGTMCILWHGVFHGTLFFCYRASGLYFAALKHQTDPACSRHSWTFVFQLGMCRRGKKKGRKDAVLVLGLDSVFIKAVKTGVRVEADPMRGKGASSNRTLCWRSYSVWRESQKHYTIKGAGKRIRYSQNS